MRPLNVRHPLIAALGFALALGVGACSPDSGSTGPDDDPGESAPDPAELKCDVDVDRFFDGGIGLGAIPALQDPVLVNAGDPGTEYLETRDRAGTENIRTYDRVVVFRYQGGWVAVPHNILWWHEIAQFSGVQRSFAVTYCPLTGSSIVFSLQDVEVTRFQVSGLLFSNNLVMRDPNTGSLWPQMLRAAGCGPQRGKSLTAVPSIETRWDQWTELHPDTRVVSSRTGFSRDYSQYPYNRYEEPNSPPLIQIENLDRRRPNKERLLGIPVGQGGVAYPFGELSTDAPVRVVRDRVDGEEVVIFWNQEALSAVAYRPRADGRELEFEVRDGRIVDTATGSTWRYDGTAAEGSMAGARLEPVGDAYVAFWFAWAIFQPDTEIWTASAGAAGS